MLKILLIPLFCLLISTTFAAHNTQPKVIGVIVPMEHKAMDEIVNGFTETLKATAPVPVIIKVKNAEGDINLRRGIIQQMRDNHYDVIVPIATGTSEMTLSYVKTQNVVSLAADIPDSMRQQQTPCHSVNVDDQINDKILINFIHTVYPSIIHITLVHSTDDKIYPEVKTVITEGKKLGIDIHPMVIQTLPDLYTVSQSLPSNTQAIFVLKDNLIVSGISSLAKSAQVLKIPLISSDQGSVQDGASFALGVHEKQIGIEGAKLVTQVLTGKSICSLPNVTMTNLTVFINKNNLDHQNQMLNPIMTAAKNAHYQIEDVSK